MPSLGDAAHNKKYFIRNKRRYAISVEVQLRLLYYNSF